MKSFLILGKDSTLAGFFLKKYGDKSVALDKSECNITDPKNLEKVFKNSEAKYILNCAALTDIKFCEANPTECFKVNTFAVQDLSHLCQKYEKKLIHFSSDYAINSTNIYGYSKFLSENLIDQTRDLVIRTSFYSPDYYIVKTLLDKKIVNAYKNMYFNPVSVTRLVEEIYKNKDQVGILNVFTDKKISKYEFAKKFAKVFEIDQNLIKPVDYIEIEELKLPLDSFIKSNIDIPLEEDLKLFLRSSKD